MKARAATIDEYLAALSDDKRAALQKLRKDVLAAARGAEEIISYGMPAFRYEGRVLAWFGAASHHCALYPGAWPIQACAKELAGYETSKGTVRFSPARPLPTSLVRKLVRARMEEQARSRERPTRRRKPTSQTS